MTSTPVMGLAATQISEVAKTTSNTNKSEGIEFKSFMNLSTGDNAKKLYTDVSSKTSDVKKSSETPKADSKQETKAVSTDNAKVEEPSSPAENTRTVKDGEIASTKDTVEEVKDFIEEELNVTEEEIANALSALGLNFLALLNPENMTEVVLKVTDTEDAVLLATDEELLNSLNEITDFVDGKIENLCKELGIDVSEFEEAISKFESIEEDLPVETENTLEAKDISFDVMSGNRSGVNSDKALEKIEINVSSEKIKLVEDKPEQAKLMNFSIQKPMEEELSEDKLTVSTQDAGKKTGNETHENVFSFVENLVKETAQALGNNEMGTTFSMVDTENIINQITESIKTDVTKEMTEISIKLHPESLGNVTVKIAANNEGVLTAKFIAESDNVKGAIESQTIALKETLEAKGVTVEAVEVTVASHQFEENLNRERKDGNPEASKKKGLRRISADVTTEDIEDDDEERIAREMMAQNGNTIDYMA